MTAVLHAVGDVAPDRDDPNECFSLAADVLRGADIGFCQLECNLTTRGVRMPQARHTHRGPVSSGQALRNAGIDIVSFAGNHCMDWGPDGLTDTIANLQAADLAVVGVGPNIVEARAPVIREVNGVRLAFLAYSSILPEAYWATESRPGCAPLRAHTHYEQIETDQPGTPARIRTFAFREDVSAMVEDIAKFLSAWLPHYKSFQRSYLTIAIGCTGGQHRSVYIAEAVAARLVDTHGKIRVRHNELPLPESAPA